MVQHFINLIVLKKGKKIWKNEVYNQQSIEPDPEIREVMELNNKFKGDKINREVHDI